MGYTREGEGIGVYEGGRREGYEARECDAARGGVM